MRPRPRLRHSRDTPTESGAKRDGLISKVVCKCVSYVGAKGVHRVAGSRLRKHQLQLDLHHLKEIYLRYIRELHLTVLEQ